MEETIKPSRKRPNARSLSIFDHGMQQTESYSAAPSPMSSTFSGSDSFNGAQMGPSAPMDMFDQPFDLQNTVDGLAHSSDHGTPCKPHQSQFSDFSDFSAPFQCNVMGSVEARSRSAHGTPASVHTSSAALSREGSPTPAGRSRISHRRTDSLASIQSAASISDINFEEAKLETGVTLFDIAKFIDGPDMMDGRWTCTYDGCNKKFGRKENIKSHVQTHLNDRQYQCPSCMKCFVRQHDLKRHAKIHTGVKPYPCLCGNSFARHDALTRHRQRGMCVGAFDGSVKKNAKRGRPRKQRPDMDERQDKSARTRRKNNMSISSVSSQSTYADSSAATTPFDTTSVEGGDMFENMIDMTQAGFGYDKYDNRASSSAPMPSISPQVLSPQAGGDVAPSPSAASLNSFVSPHMIMSDSPPLLSSPTTSRRSQLNTPPPDAPSTEPSREPGAAFLAVDPDASVLQEVMANPAADSSASASSNLDLFMPPEYGDAETRSYADAMFGVVSEDKFGNLYGTGVTMFDPGDDSYFAPNDN